MNKEIQKGGDRMTDPAFENKVVVITGENICIDGGMTRQMIYHGDGGWSYTQP